MKKILLATVLSIAPSVLFAQSAIDAYQLTQGELKGTARFMSMGGAFGALGGDLSTLTQNPAGIGVYRSSEVGVTFDLNFQATKSNSDGYSLKEDQTKFYCPNFGYVGTVKLNNNVMPIFNWGVSYSRSASFDRIYRGGMPNISTSLSNYIANFSSGYAPDELNMTSDYNPYWDYNVNADWLSILAYNTYLINPIGFSSDYNGLYKYDNQGNPITAGDAMFSVREQGYVDEYSINFGGNFVDMVYWGVGLGITDLGYSRYTYYDENLADARVIAIEEVNENEYIEQETTGNAYYALENYKHVSGTGYNFKVGLIVKPINELRLGLAVHTPTYYDLRQDYDAELNYQYLEEPEYLERTDVAVFDYKLRTPWKIMASAAGVIGGRAIVSFDYEYNAYNDMVVKDDYGYTYDDVTGDIDRYFKGQNIFRIGAEYRITPKFSVRAGYNYQMSNVKDAAANGSEYIYTSGTDPSYTFDNKTQYVTCGLGYRTGGFYIDAAYVYKNRESEYHAFTNFDGYEAPKATIKDNNNSIVLSVGYKF